MDIAEFLTARLDEQEAAANEFYTKRGADTFTHQHGLFQARAGILGHEMVKAPRFSNIEYEALNWVLTDVAAKRAILAEHATMYRSIGWLEDGDEAGSELSVCGRCVSKHSYYASRADVPEGPCRTARLLALPYADHPDYDASWRP